MPGNKYIVSVPEEWYWTQPAAGPYGEDPVEQDPSLQSTEELVDTIIRQRAYIQELNTKIQQLQEDKRSLARKSLADLEELASLREHKRVYDMQYSEIRLELHKTEAEYKKVLLQSAVWMEEVNALQKRIHELERSPK